MQVFYTQDINLEIARFKEEECKHAIQVLRVRNGENVSVIDGKGRLFEGIAVIEKKNFHVHSLTLKKQLQEPDQKIHLMISPTKNADRIEWLLEKIVEIGIWSFTPIICERTVKSGVNLKRLNAIATSAMKQSLRLHMPVILEPIEWKKIMFDKNSDYCFGYCGELNKTKIESYSSSKKDVYLIIGPEGDFTEKEIEFFLINNCTAISLGEERLRTETAGLVGCVGLKLKL